MQAIANYLRELGYSVEPIQVGALPLLLVGGENNTYLLAHVAPQLQEELSSFKRDWRGHICDVRDIEHAAEMLEAISPHGFLQERIEHGRRVRDKILAYIAESERNGRSPSLDDIAVNCGLKTRGTVADHVGTLVKEGKLGRGEKRARRSLRVTEG